MSGEDRAKTEGVRYDQATMTLSKRLRAAIRIDAINGTHEDRVVVARQIGEAAGTIDRLLADVAAVEAQLAEAVELLRITAEEFERAKMPGSAAILRAFLAKVEAP